MAIASAHKDLDQHIDLKKPSANGTRRAELGRFLKASRSRSQPGRRRPAARPAPPHARPAPRGGRAAGRGRRDLVHVARAGPSHQRQHPGPRRRGPDAPARPGRPLAPLPAGRGHARCGPGPSPTWCPRPCSRCFESLDPAPAMLINSRYDVIESNSASEDFFWDWHSLPCVHRNTLWCCVTEPQARESVRQLRRRGPVHGRADARRLRRARGRAGVGGGHPPPERA